jgi:hypothetical protein
MGSMVSFYIERPRGAAMNWDSEFFQRAILKFARWRGLLAAVTWVGAGVSQNEVLDEHRLKIEMFRNGVTGADGRVYEGSAFGDAYQADMPAILPMLLPALLHEFPGRNGESRVVTLAQPSKQNEK